MRDPLEASCEALADQADDLVVQLRLAPGAERRLGAAGEELQALIGRLTSGSAALRSSMTSAVVAAGRVALARQAATAVVTDVTAWRSRLALTARAAAVSSPIVARDLSQLRAELHSRELRLPSAQLLLSRTLPLLQAPWITPHLSPEPLLTEGRSLTEQAGAAASAIDAAEQLQQRANLTRRQDHTALRDTVRHLRRMWRLARLLSGGELMALNFDILHEALGRVRPRSQGPDEGS